MKYLLAIIATAAILGSPAVAQEAPPQWELKGLHLDMTIDEVKTAFPASECKNYAPGIDMCIDETATFAGGSAHLVTKFVDGQLINVTVNRISIDQTESAAQGLIAKFGQPQQNFTRRVYVKSTKSNRVVSSLTWEANEASIDVDPMDLYLPKANQNFGTVVLMYRDRHNNVWVPRAKGQSNPVATDI